MLLLTTVGSRTGQRRTVPLNFSQEGDDLVVIASAGGSSRHPAWFVNLGANPEVEIEHDGETFMQPS